MRSYKHQRGLIAEFEDESNSTKDDVSTLNVDVLNFLIIIKIKHIESVLDTYRTFDLDMIDKILRNIVDNRVINYKDVLHLSKFRIKLEKHFIRQEIIKLKHQITDLESKL